MNNIYAGPNDEEIEFFDTIKKDRQIQEYSNSKCNKKHKIVIYYRVVNNIEHFNSIEVDSRITY